MFIWKNLATTISIVTLLSASVQAAEAETQIKDEPTSSAVARIAYQPTSSASSIYIAESSNSLSNHPRPTIALALGGGGIRGAAHIGVLKVFQRENIPVDFIVGSSMGAIVGGMYAAGVPLDSLEGMFRDRSLLKAFTPISDTIKLMTIPPSMIFRSTKRAMGFKTNLIGLHASNNIASYVNRRVSPYHRTIENTEIPFVAVTTNLLDGKPYSLAHGDLGKAVQASSAIPFYVKPVEIDGKLLVDGALRSNVPSVQARESHADIVISVNVDEELQNINQTSLQKVTPYGNRVLSIVLAEIDRHQSEFADLEIHPELSPMPLYSRKVKDAERAMLAGEQAAENVLPQIKALLNSKLASSSYDDSMVQY